MPNVWISGQTLQRFITYCCWCSPNVLMLLTWLICFVHQQRFPMWCLATGAVLLLCSDTHYSLVVSMGIPCSACSAAWQLGLYVRYAMLVPNHRAPFNAMISYHMLLCLFNSNSYPFRKIDTHIHEHHTHIRAIYGHLPEFTTMFVTDTHRLGLKIRWRHSMSM